MSIDSVSPRQAECLITWPQGTKGYAEEKILVLTLITLCEKYGYGRVPQLAKQIEELWRDPNSKEKFERSKEAHFRMMREGWEEAFGKDRPCPY